MKKLLIILVPAIFILLAFRNNNTFTVSGSITDQKGNPIPAASIKVKGTNKGTNSGLTGNYTIEIVNSEQTLVFSAVGYKVQEVAVKGKATINVVLLAEIMQLDEVVVTSAYAVQRKSNLSASVQSVSNYGYGLAGKVAGVVVSGNTGAATSIKIRGNATYNPVDSDYNTEGYDHIIENPFLQTTTNPLSTFSIDVDAAAYSNVRRYLNAGQLPPAGAVRIEEMVNYFKYEYPQPTQNEPFSIHTEISTAPWNKDHQLVLIGLQGKKVPTENLPSSNLVFLVDVSGSMQGPDRIGLVKASMKMLVDQLRQEDKVAIVVYAGAAGLVLPSTNGLDKTKIKDAIDRLEAGGSTAGGAGIKLAYKTAAANLVKGGNNRVILCTDGDFNVGESSDDAMERLIVEERKSGVFLTVLGYGMGNYKDNKMQKLADKGNGNHAYIDGISEAKKVLVNEFGGTLFTIAKDVKLQVEFNPAKVQGYRLIGYENRMLAKEDFNDDKKDAGELGSGHTVTALYEVIPVGVKSNWLKKIDSLKYQANTIEPLSQSVHTDELLTVKFRYKAPGGEVSKLIEHPVKDARVTVAETSTNFRFAIAVAEFGMLLRNSAFKSNASYVNVLSLAENAKGNDTEGYRAEFLQLVKKAEKLSNELKTVAAEEEEENVK